MTAGSTKINPIVELRTTLGASRGEIVAAADGQLPYSRLAKIERGNGDQADLATARRVLTQFVSTIEARLTTSIKSARALLATLPDKAPASATVPAAASTPTKRAPAKKAPAKKAPAKAPAKRVTARKQIARIEAAKSS